MENGIFLSDISKNKNINMSSMIEKSSSIMKLIYEIKEEKEIQILAHNFNIMKSVFIIKI